MVEYVHVREYNYTREYKVYLDSDNVADVLKKHPHSVIPDLIDAAVRCADIGNTEGELVLLTPESTLSGKHEWHTPDMVASDVAYPRVTYRAVEISTRSLPEGGIAKRMW